MATMAELDALAQAVPGLNQRVAKQQQAAQRIQARAAAGTAPQTMGTRQVATTLAAPLATAQSQVAQQSQARTQQQLGTIAQQGAQEEAFQGQQALQRRGLGQQAALGTRGREVQSSLTRGGLTLERDLTQKEIRQAQELARFGIQEDLGMLQLNLSTREDLNRLGNDLEGKLFDSRRRFEQDEMGRKFSNSRQLADFAVQTAEDQLELQDRMQTIEQAHRKKMLLLQVAHQKLTQTLASEAAMKEAGLTRQHRIEMQQIKNNLDKQIAREKTRAAYFKTFIQTATTVGGFMIGGPAGATGGAAVGAAATQ